MKKRISLAIAFFFATAAIAEEEYVASPIITEEVLSGKLEQTVTVGDNIEQTKIVYTKAKGALKTEGFSALGLSASCTANQSEKKVSCTVSGEIKRNLVVPTTIKPFILVEDDNGRVAITYFTFNLQARPTTLKVIKGETTQSVKAGESISDVEIEYAGIKSFIYSSSPAGIKVDKDSVKQILKISGKIDERVATGEYKYKVRGITQDEKDTLSVEITFKVTGKPVSLTVSENATQKVVAGDSIKPVTFSFTGANDLKITKTPPGKFSAMKDGESMTIVVSGYIDENTKDGTYTIELEATDGDKMAKAQATVEVTHKVMETKVVVSKNASQTVTAGDSIKPIVFNVEHMSEIVELTGFPGSYEVIPDNNTVTVYGVLKEDAKGEYKITLKIKGTDNSATADATINVTPVKLKFDLIEGSANQTVVAGKDIVPMVYRYEHLKLVKGSGLPADLKMEQDPEKKQVKIYGTVDSESAAKEYVYSLELTDIYSEITTITGKINVVRASSSSSESTSSSSEKTVSSSSKETSSSSETTKPASSSSETTSSSSEKTVSSSSEETSSSSETTKPTSSSSEKAKSSSSEKSKSSSSTAESSSSSKKGKSSSSEKTAIIATVVPSFEFGFVNNELTVVLPKPAMLRVQVFDMMGHRVETFAESVVSSKSFNLAHLNMGNYVVRIESERYARTAKILVK